MKTSEAATFSLRSAQQTLGLSRTVLAGLIEQGFVKPARGPRNEHRFTFQDLALLRTAHALQQSGIPPRKILRSLAKLKAELPAELPLTGLRISAVGTDVAVRGRDGALESASGQMLMDFELAPTGARLAFLDRRAPAAPDPLTLFHQGEAHEAAKALAQAETSYRKALALSPCLAAAYLNLGAMLCESDRCADAVTLYDTAVAHLPDDPWIWFNRAIALEDLGRDEDAVQSYEQSLRRDPAIADAHFNLGRLLERAGDGRGALRHFNAYRRLNTGEGR